LPSQTLKNNMLQPEPESHESGDGRAYI
jgi:hypothetical protein